MPEKPGTNPDKTMVIGRQSFFQDGEDPNHQERYYDVASQDLTKQPVEPPVSGQNPSSVGTYSDILNLKHNSKTAQPVKVNKPSAN